MTELEFKKALDTLFKELNKSDNAKSDKSILAKAVQLGMKYQEDKIRQGIEIVFDELHKK